MAHSKFRGGTWTPVSVKTGTRWEPDTDPDGVHRVAAPYAALVTFDDGPGTPVTVILSAIWCRDYEAKTHVERRMPELHVEYRLTGRRVRALVCPATTEVKWDLNNMCVPALVERLCRNIGPGAEFAEIRDNKVISWFIEGD